MMFLGAMNAHSQCLENAHSPFANHSWLSCQEKENPNPEREAGHWIMYDLQFTYSIDSMFVWNYNRWSETGNGAKVIAIDYSLDGINWLSAGEFDIDKAPGSWKYTDAQELDLEIDIAQYVLISVLETWDALATCAGLSELKMNVEQTSSLEELGITDLSLYPNPVHSILNLELDNEHNVRNAMIYSNIGQEIMAVNLEGRTEIQIDLSGLADGFYYLSLEDGRTRAVEKFIKLNSK